MRSRPLYRNRFAAPKFVCRQLLLLPAQPSRLICAPVAKSFVANARGRESFVCGERDELFVHVDRNLMPTDIM